jgi:hypothetical protein
MLCGMSLADPGPTAAAETSGWRSRRGTGRLVLAAGALLVVVTAVVIYLATRPPDQKSLDASVFPLVAHATVGSSFMDCDKATAIGYLEHWPCETFVLVQSSHFGTAQAFDAAEQARLRAAGWHYSARGPIPVDYGAVGEANAPSAASWTDPGNSACAVVLTDTAGIALESKAILRPYDPYNQPHGLISFYRLAGLADRADTLWVRLIPDDNGYGRSLC